MIDRIIQEAALLALSDPKTHERLAESMGVTEDQMQQALEQVEEGLMPTWQIVATHAAVEHHRAVANLYAA